jgi:hypothetical protein
LELMQARVTLQVSRRLTRHTKKALYEHHYGSVKVAVTAYCQLLDHSSEEGCSYTFTYFNKELIHQPDAMVRRPAAGPPPEPPCTPSIACPASHLHPAPAASPQQA